ncbi:hypothetical protein DFJ74DRAFT_245225 [Hyaloraphidium curvatum]|nr:hypothetical protein DFJ74DRAFT_245225 [Hyaloraphidium curvatum]
MQTSLRAFLPVQKGRAAASKPSLKRSRDFVENQLHPQNEENDSPRRIASPRKRPRGQKDSPADALARKAHDLLRETGKHPAFFTVDGEDVEDSAGTAPLAGSESTVVEDPSPPLLVGPGSPPAADLQEATRDAILESTTEEQEPINELPNGGTHSISVLSRPLDDTSTSDTVGEDEWNEPPPPSPTRSVVLPMASGHALPAYLRLQSRTTLQKPRAQALPPSYDLLLRFFAELDQVVRHWRSRSQPCLLSKCKKHIESTVRRSANSCGGLENVSDGIWHPQHVRDMAPAADCTCFPGGLHFHSPESQRELGTRSVACSGI